MKDELRKDVERFAEEARKDLRESKHGLLKLSVLEAVPVVMGATLGGIARTTGEPWIPAVPVAMDLFWGSRGYGTTREFLGLVKYGIGVALPYADKVYYAVQGLMDIV